MLLSSLFPKRLMNVAPQTSFATDWQLLLLVMLSAWCEPAFAAEEKNTSKEISKAEEQAIWERKNSEQVKKIANQRNEKINSEIKSLEENHPWAGKYFYGDGLGVNVNLDLAPDGGFVFNWRGCLGDYDRNFGKVRFVDDILHLDCELPNLREGFQGTDTNLFLVTWGKRCYLVGESEMPKFCNAVNSGQEPRTNTWGRFLLRNGHEALLVSGAPSLPQRFQSYLLTKPLETTVTKVELPRAEQTSITEFKIIYSKVTIDVGTKQGVFLGMDFFSLDPKLIHFGHVIRLGEDSAVVELMTTNRDKPIQAGLKLSTRPAWR